MLKNGLPSMAMNNTLRASLKFTLALGHGNTVLQTATLVESEFAYESPIKLTFNECDTKSLLFVIHTATRT